MRMPPHSMMPGDKDALKGVELQDGTWRRVWGFAKPYRRTIRLSRHDHRLRTAGVGATLRLSGDHRQRDPRQGPWPDRLPHRAGGTRRHRRCCVGHRAALDERQGRRGSDLRPAPGSLRQDPADADRVLHTDTDRLDHLASQQRRDRRPDGGDEHVGQHRQQRDRARHDPGSDVLAAMATHAADPHRAAAVRRPGQARRRPPPGHRPPADGLQRRDEHPDDRALQRLRCDTREAVRLGPTRARRVRSACRRRSRHRHPIGAARTRVLRRTRARRRTRHAWRSTASARSWSSTATSRSAPWWHSPHW